MVKCGLGHAVPNTVIDRPSAPPFDAASMDDRSGRSMFAYGCPLNEMGSRRHPAHAICPPPPFPFRCSFSFPPWLCIRGVPHWLLLLGALGLPEIVKPARPAPPLLFCL